MWRVYVLLELIYLFILRNSRAKNVAYLLQHQQQKRRKMRFTRDNRKKFRQHSDVTMEHRHILLILFTFEGLLSLVLYLAWLYAIRDDKVSIWYDSHSQCNANRSLNCVFVCGGWLDSFAALPSSQGHQNWIHHTKQMESHLIINWMQSFILCRSKCSTINRARNSTAYTLKWRRYLTKSMQAIS